MKLSLLPQWHFKFATLATVAFQICQHFKFVTLATVVPDFIKDAKT